MSLDRLIAAFTPKRKSTTLTLPIDAKGLRRRRQIRSKEDRSKPTGPAKADR
jgi:hypothetical protein